MKNVGSVIALLAFIASVNCHDNSSTKATPTESAPTATPAMNFSTPSPFAEGNHEPKKPINLATISPADLSAVRLHCATNGHCMNQTAEAVLRRAFVKHLWMDILRQASPYKQNLRWAKMKAETYMRKSFTAKYILMRLFGFPAKLAMPTDDGLFEGDVMLPEFVTDEIIRKGVSISAELRSDAELMSVLEANDRDVNLDNVMGDKATNDERSALRVDKLRAVSWSSSVFYHVDKSIGSNATAVLQAIGEMANATGGCLTFTARAVVSEQNLADTIIIKKMPKASNVSISSCVIASLGKLPFNFLFVNFSCPNVKGEILHGLMHVLGVVHEHNRVDRDEHITVQWSKLAPEFFGFFTLDRPQFVSTFGTPFDFGSITFISPSIGVSKLGDSSFVPKNASAVFALPLGQREHLSCADADILRRMYCCSQSCSDRLGLCGFWSTKGACAGKENWSWMKHNCPRSCRECCNIDCAPSCSDYCGLSRHRTCHYEHGVEICHEW